MPVKYSDAYIESEYPVTDTLTYSYSRYNNDIPDNPKISIYNKFKILYKNTKKYGIRYFCYFLQKHVFEQKQTKIQICTCPIESKKTNSTCTCDNNTNNTIDIKSYILNKIKSYINFVEECIMKIDSNIYTKIDSNQILLFFIYWIIHVYKKIYDILVYYHINERVKSKNNINRLKKKLFLQTYDRLKEYRKSNYFDKISTIDVLTNENLVYERTKYMINQQFKLYDFESKLKIIESLEDVGQGIIKYIKNDNNHYITYSKIYDEIEISNPHIDDNIFFWNTPGSTIF